MIKYENIIKTICNHRLLNTITDRKLLFLGDECLSNLKNIVVHEGQQNTVMHLASDPQTVIWSVLPTSDESSLQNIIDFGCNKNPSLTELYDFNQAGLVIKDATTIGSPISTAGLYVGQCANNDNKMGAKLLVIRKFLGNFFLFFLYLEKLRQLVVYVFNRNVISGHFWLCLQLRHILALEANCRC